jgi:hypothetical protein
MGACWCLWKRSTTLTGGAPMLAHLSRVGFFIDDNAARRSLPQPILPPSRLRGLILVHPGSPTPLAANT